MDRAAITKRDVLEHILFDGSVEAIDLPFSLLEYITDGFSNEKQIGRGGFAVVYKGTLRNGTIAVKKLELNTHLHENKFKDEVECLMKAKHKNIVRFLGYCADTHGKMERYNGKVVLAEVPQRLLCFEYLPKGSLRYFITDAFHELEWTQCFQIIKGICAGLHYLHENCIVHLDLKPDNILFDDNMVPKIADFGLSRCFDEMQSHVLTSKLYGTLGYIAPEVIYSGRITYKSDMYSLGVIINEILSGNKMYLEDYDVLKSWGNRLDELHWEKQFEQLQVCAEIGKECTDFDQERRPDAQAILRRLDEVNIVADSRPEEADIVNMSIVTGISNLSIAQEEIHKVEEPGDENQQLFGAIGHELKSIVASLSQSFQSLERNKEYFRLRRLSGVAEHWIYVRCDWLEWKAYNLEHRHSTYVPPMPGTEYSCTTEAEWNELDFHSLAVGTDLLVFGSNFSKPTLLRYSILTNSWIQTTDMRKFYHFREFGSTSVGQKAYLAGGRDFDNYIVINTAAIYDSEEKVWERLPSMNKARRLCSVAFMDGKLYVIGGQGRHNHTLTCGEEYDFERGSWRVINDMLYGDFIENLRVAVVNNELYGADTLSKKIKKYDMQNNRWITLGKLPESFYDVIGFKASGNKLITAGSIVSGPRWLRRIDDPVEIYYWVPSEQPPAWNLIAGHPSESLFLLNFTVMSV